MTVACFHAAIVIGEDDWIDCLPFAWQEREERKYRKGRGGRGKGESCGFCAIFGGILETISGRCRGYYRLVSVLLTVDAL